MKSDESSFLTLEGRGQTAVDQTTAVRSLLFIVLPWLTICCWLLACSSQEREAGSAGGSTHQLALIPTPLSVHVLEGSFTLEASTSLKTARAFAPTVEREVELLRRATGLELPVRVGEVSAAEANNKTIRIVTDQTLATEGYRLTADAEGLSIAAATEAGAFYGLQTLRQLLPPSIESGTTVAGVQWTLPWVTIEDQPRFPYRGLHLDVGRHFFGVDYVKSMLDTMARFKFNRFHWHLTEDQGWRIEIDAFPRLTEIAAFRSETQVADNFDPFVGDGQRYGGFYSKAEVREVVAYAAERHITVIPEIEMPGHATAAIAAYPELGCGVTGTAPPPVATGWGVMDTIFCPKEETFRFLEQVLDEVLELFPSELIHIGGDEVPKEAWQESRQAQAVILREGLANENELQSWFIRRIERHLASRGRRLIGWDEILEGGLAPNATVMTWRHDKSAVTAAELGHDVIRTPHQFTYFDFYQGDHAEEPLAMNWARVDVALNTVYAFDPVPEGLDRAAIDHIIGGQANLWTEYISTPEHAEYMLYPRALALAEVLWSATVTRDWDDFLTRLAPVLEHLDNRSVNYRWPKEFLSR